ncbi:spore gernimation protein GerB [Mesobacillus campisalis]|uniref:Spore gernimation protein GerB n=1 Tax=Mesobacillus campisalis TaxID=1408103 RepID=A0A0M2T3J7_9BACI|nr:GerAB/ArcD/ProY family transporter [Mesobacillus campisalis]KKK39375.1 spore gernimation protein GerB [Mesobacillus campisalis]
MREKIEERFQISPFLALYAIVSMQIGIGVLGFQRIISMEAGYDAWISVLLSGISIHAIVWMMYKICETAEGDAVTANLFAYGSMIGKGVSFLFILYFIILSVAILRGYIEVIQVWVFPELSVWGFAAVFLVLVIYIIYGGFRTVVGIAFFGLVLPAYLLLVFGFAFRYSDFTNLLPILDHTPIQLLKSSFHMSLTYMGFEVLLFIYPYIKKPEQSKKWVHFGVIITTVFYTAIAVITFAYFSEKLLQKSIWATLDMWKIVNMPFVERFEYIGIANWVLIILPNVCLCIWSASRIMKQIFPLRQRKAVIIIAIVCLIIVGLLDTRQQVNMFMDLTGKIGFILNYLYVPFLFVSVLIARKVKKK